MHNCRADDEADDETDGGADVGGGSGAMKGVKKLIRAIRLPLCEATGHSDGRLAYRKDRLIVGLVLSKQSLRSSRLRSWILRPMLLDGACWPLEEKL